MAHVFRIPFKEHSLITCYPEGTDLSCLEFKGRMWFSSCPWEGWAPGLSHERLPGFIIPWHLGLFSRLLSSRNRLVLLPCSMESRAQLHSLRINHSAKLKRGEASEPAPTTLCRPVSSLCLPVTSDGSLHIIQESRQWESEVTLNVNVYSPKSAEPQNLEQWRWHQAPHSGGRF